MLQNEYLVVKIGVDTAENEPLKVLTSFKNLNFLNIFALVQFHFAIFLRNADEILSEFRDNF